MNKQSPKSQWTLFCLWIKKHWIIRTLFTVVPAVIFSVGFELFGEALNLVTLKSGSKIPTGLGFFLILVCIICIVTIALVNNQDAGADFNDERTEYENKITYLTCMIESSEVLCNSKFLQLRKTINSVLKNEIPAPKIISNPSDQIRRLTEEIPKRLKVLLEGNDNNLGENDIYVNIMYRFPGHNSNWNMADNPVKEAGLSIKTLLNDSKSTIYFLINESKSDFVFYNRKQQAVNDNHYVEGTRDERNTKNDLCGSILCKKIDIQIGENDPLQIIIIITTYTKPLIALSGNEYIKLSKEDRAREINVRDNIKSKFLPKYEKRLNIEFCLLYLEHLCAISD